ncbi:mitogen-activated protein kinase kinase kinase 3 [Phalaenopsis equestris]|uniref:mitogen-activated protein kinase kinase kinase 3 n=2 Tax=Phalaenopsis equestris TaxID=78828 RepID=UPI0009E43527|nr:mitogen-activated protein kinase kinase kinase 3 [Phalaenopsis equestris]
MPAWWKARSKSKAKKTSSSSDSTPRKNPWWWDDEPKLLCTLTPKHWRQPSKDKANSFHGVSTAPVASSSCDGDLKGLLVSHHPLPRPSVSSPLLSPPPLDLGPAAASGSASASSVSSSGSSDDTPDLAFYRMADPINMARGRSALPGSQSHQHVAEARHFSHFNPVLEHSRNPEMPVSPRKEIHLHDLNATSNPNICSPATTYLEGIFNPRTVNCAPISRGSPFCISPVHSGVQSVCPGSPTAMQDGLRSPPQPLPLPPISTNSLSSSLRPSQSSWKKGKLLGRGTFGHVYLGFNSESGQMCAIKEVPVISDDSNSKESLKQLNQEINLLCQLSHPNIVQYYGSELADDTLSVYLEYVSGGSIHKLLQEYGSFGEPVIKNYTAQILSGLAYLHGRNTVHRDIKGANILVDPNGEVKLADFGMAKHISSYTSIRSFKGSPYWMAPEVIMNGNGYNLSVDIWSLGCTVLEMATSKPPWSQFEGVAAIFKIGNSKDIPDIPEHLSSVAKSFIMSCLRRDPSARPTAAQLMDHPFVHDQAAIKSAKLSVSKDMFPPDGSYSRACKDYHSNRSVSPLRDKKYELGHRGQAAMDYRNNRSVSPLRGKNYETGHGVAIPLVHENASDLMGMRMNMSLPVSPCSSPRHQQIQFNRSCVPSPIHPAYSAGALTYGPSNHYLYQVRPSHNFTDPSLDISELRIQTPYSSPKR